MTALRNTLRAMLAVLSTLPALACGPTDADEQLGRVELTLSAADANGNTWRLPAGTYLHVQKGNFQDNLLLDGNAAVASFSLPVGMFDWELWNPNVFGGEWPLELVDAQNNVEIVNATLTNPQPDTFLVLPSSTTSLSLQFDAALGGSITFAKGTVAVDLAVTAIMATGGNFAMGGLVEAAIVDNGATAPPVLATSLPALGDSFELTLGGHVDGAWDMWSSDKVCAPIAVDFVGSDSSGVTDLLFESASEVANGNHICLNTAGVVEIAASRAAAPVTSTFSGLGSSNLAFNTLLVIQLPVVAFDGETLDLGILSGTHNASSTAFLNVAELSNGNWYSATANGQVTFNFAPAP
jgi:hypothetical protein